MHPLLYFALFIILFGIVLILKRILFYRNTAKAIGTVISIRGTNESMDIDKTIHYNRLTYIPRIQFIDEDGKTHTFCDNLASRFFIKTVGKKIGVIYDPRNPKRVFINNIFIIWVRPIAITGFGIFLYYFMKTRMF